MTEAKKKKIFEWTVVFFMLFNFVWMAASSASDAFKDLREGLMLPLIFHGAFALSWALCIAYFIRGYFGVKSPSKGGRGQL
ncbi:hypothetical protein [Nitrospirillum amazonense]|uniref:hypothetical protein n=1 Tax=Nitrospirillum amazonense TaxID=28077 RepID=UPI00241279BF|nr:hypothetical protein [Nitrospirillum amazonense]MDG3444588.1 hypothetical protein [Nitrospirillum amazonense]